MTSLRHLEILLAHHDAVRGSLLVSGVLNGSLKELAALAVERDALLEQLAVCREVKDGYYQAMDQWRSLAQESAAALAKAQQDFDRHRQTQALASNIRNALK